MENSQRTSSVIAKLMGFDQMPPQQQPLSRPQRVLSDIYLQKSGSIGKRSRTYSQNNHLASKKRANQRTYDSNKDSFSRNIGHKSLSFDGMQDIKSENGKSYTELKAQAISSFKKIVCKPKLANVQYAFPPSFLLHSQSISAWEAKKQLLERLKMTKVSQEHRSGSQSCSLHDIFSLNNTESMSRSNFGSSIGINKDKSTNYESATKLPIFKQLNLSSSLTKKPLKMTRSDMKPSSGKLVNTMPTNTKNHLVSSEQDSTIQSHEDVSRSSNGKQFSEEHPDSKIEAYHHSPNSVLEPPFRDYNSSSSEYCESASNDLHDLWMEDDFNPEMVTSSDDERSWTDQNIRSIIPFEAKESRDFSYLLDVLDESGFQGGNVEIQFEKWHSLESMAAPSVFETLEKKYGKQELWHKAERRLLFDRINTAMLKILRPRIDICVFSNILQKKMRNMSRRDVIEEELLTFLLGQETGVSDGVSEKAVGRGPWFDPVDEIDSLVREIEIFLYDELTTELVCIMG